MHQIPLVGVVMDGMIVVLVVHVRQAVVLLNVLVIKLKNVGQIKLLAPL
jgi:hypothetical protein